MYTIIIDSGTTHSRIRLVYGNNLEAMDAFKLKVGVRNTAITGHNHELKETLIEGIKQIIRKNNITPNQVGYIIASGMITSNLGLYEVPHITAPASLEDFVQNCQGIIMEDFYQIPCIFVPGMKNASNFSEQDFSIDQMDMLRGEEVETYGLLAQLRPEEKGLMILPGSHTKYILIDEDQTLVSSFSTLGGEVISAIRSSTILSSSLDPTLIETIDTSQLIAGYNAAKDVGFTRSIYHIRLMKLFSEGDHNGRANYFVGAVLQSDIKALSSFLEHQGKLNWIIVGGSSPLRTAFVKVLQEENIGELDIIEATEEQVDCALIYGSQQIGNKYFQRGNKGNENH